MSVYNVFGDAGSTVSPVVVLPLVALGVGVLVLSTLLGDAPPTDAVSTAD